MTSKQSSSDLVEAAIEAMVSGNTDLDGVVSNLLEPGSSGVVEFNLEEDSEPACVKCGNKSMEEGEVEGNKAFYCRACDTGYVAEPELNESDDPTAEFYEAEIDEDNPQCPVCESDDLEFSLQEAEGEEIPVILCGGCGAGMVVSQEED
jgi:hypothetical protein